MRYALIDGERREATRGLVGLCLGCGAPLRPRCGEVRVHHWAHHGTRHCDHWWEPETEWHRAWKDRFPGDWQERRRQAPDGEWHIADVESPHGGVLEFQHSAISLDERRSREQFYGRMAWIVNGLRLKRDLPAFEDAIKFGRVASTKPFLCDVRIEGNHLLTRWQDSRVPVFFDFGDHQWGILSKLAQEPLVWRYKGERSHSHARLVAVPASSLVTHYADANTPLKIMVLPTVQQPDHRPQYRSRRSMRRRM